MSVLCLGLLTAMASVLIVAPGTPVSTIESLLTTPSVTVTIPRHAERDLLTALTLEFSRNVAAVEGRVVVDGNVAELVGVVPARGVALRPARVTSGYAFVAYDITQTTDRNAVQLVVLPRKAGWLQLRVAIDSIADSGGHRLKAPGIVASATVRVDPGATDRTAEHLFAAPTGATFSALAPHFIPKPVHKLIGAGVINRLDLDEVRYGWTTEHAQNTSCSRSPSGDINDDGCVDAVDLQATMAAIERADNSRATTSRHTPNVAKRTTITPIPGRTFTVTSTADTADTNRGDGKCADSQGRCTLRAAIVEADWDYGDDTINFNINSRGVPVIQLSGGLPLITSLKGTLTIDGYTQPGARANSARFLTNGRPGVEVRGNGLKANEFGFYITSGGNIIRGLAVSYINTAIMLDGTNATQNRIVGNWIGFSGSGANSGGNYGVLVNTGANHNMIGTPGLADRNLIGSWATGANNYGPGTDFNVYQNNVFCIAPGGGTAECGTGIDHNFGPKYGLIGGTSTDQRNVFGPTSLQAVEYSHGWDRALPCGTDTKTTYQINDNRLIGNWLGFRADGTPDSNYSSGKTGTGDNGQAVNVYDGSNHTLVRRNYISSGQDGVQVMAPNAKYNEVRGNFIGIAPNGQPALLGHYGVRLRWQAQWEIVQGNTIRNAGLGGIGMTMHTVYNTRLSRNIITDTGGPAILATFDSATNTGSDMWVPAPLITGATTAEVRGTGIEGAEVEVYKTSPSANTSQGGLPSTYLGTAIVAGGSWALRVGHLSLGDQVTALQIRRDQNTSVLSAPVKVS